MAGALMNKVWNLFGMDSAEPEEYEDEEVYEDEDEELEEDKKYLEEETTIIKL